MTATQPALDDAFDWTLDCQPGDQTPSRFDCRQHEMRDCRGQHAGPAALWTARNVPTQEYL